jgi:hypothetical protein
VLCVCEYILLNKNEEEKREGRVSLYLEKKCVHVYIKHRCMSVCYGYVFLVCASL